MNGRSTRHNDGVDAAAVIAALELVAHPEGGHYRETWRDSAGTAIYFLLEAGEHSAWHRLHGRAETWHFYAGAPLELSVALGTDTVPAGAQTPAGAHTPAGAEAARSTATTAATATATIRLGPDLLSGEQPQAVVPPGAWQRARSLGSWSLVGCTVAPPFTFDAFELASTP
jgi:predicted cupin superfamily sugar epimerase